MLWGVKECSDEVVELFLEHVGRVATYAYFRALYANLDWSATLNSQPRPVLQCHSAWGPSADRQSKYLIDRTTEGSLLGAYSHVEVPSWSQRLGRESID